MKAIILALAIVLVTAFEALAGGHGGYGGHGYSGYGHGYHHGCDHHGWYTDFAVGVGLGALASPWYWGSGYGYYGRGYYYAPPVVYAPAPVYYASPAVVERTVVVEKPVVVNNYYYSSGNDHWKPHFSGPVR
jgi:hypothetical protein